MPPVSVCKECAYYDSIPETEDGYCISEPPNPTCVCAVGPPEVPEERVCFGRVSYPVVPGDRKPCRYFKKA